MMRQIVIEFLGSKCNMCMDIKDLMVDHIVPFDRGGKNMVKNLQLLCRICHHKKTMKEMKGRRNEGGYQ